MEPNRRGFLKVASLAGAGIIPIGNASGLDERESRQDEHETRRKPESITELFLDNALIEVTPGVSRRLHKPKKHLLNPVVRCDRWCEGNNIQPYTTMYDHEAKLFKMWARAGSDWNSRFLDGHSAYMLYFTSTDGVHWDKPDLGVTTIAGRRDHNVIFTSDMVPPTEPRISGRKREFIESAAPTRPQGKKAFFWAVNRHPHPRDPREKFVALAIVQDHRPGAHLVTSPDGIHWSCANAPFWQSPNDISSKGDDCLMHLMYDRAKQKWVLYRRIIPEFSERMIANETDLQRQAADRYYRSYAYAESEDLRKWKNHQFILSMDPDDPGDTELY
jgi:hypothetical protein